MKRFSETEKNRNEQNKIKKKIGRWKKKDCKNWIKKEKKFRLDFRPCPTQQALTTIYAASMWWTSYT